MRWQSFSRVEKLVIFMLVTGSLLGGYLWLSLHGSGPSQSSPAGGSEAVGSRLQPPPGQPPPTQQRSSLVAIMPTVSPAVQSRCADALRRGTGRDASSTNVNDVRVLVARQLLIPVAGVEKGKLYDSFDDGRGARKHQAIDIHAPRGTPVIAAGDGCIVKLFRSIPGGITLYQFDPEGNFAYYYAHLERYAVDLKEGLQVKRGDVLGYVGTSGNATANAPHLHFSIFRLGPEKRWWQGTAVNPYAVFTDR